MDRKKHPTTGEWTTFKGKFVGTAEFIFSLSGLNLRPIMRDTVFAPSQGAARDTHSPSTYEAQLFQMFADIRRN